MSPVEAQRSKMHADIDGAVNLAKRFFFGDETFKDIVGGGAAANAVPFQGRPVPVPVPAVEEGPCAVCGAKPDADIAERMITRADKKTIPCPGCLGRK